MSIAVVWLYTVRTRPEYSIRMNECSERSLYNGLETRQPPSSIFGSAQCLASLK